MRSGMTSAAHWLSILEIAWINILLSGDNAIVIAMACRSLPERQRQLGVVCGSIAAIVLRILFALAVTWLLAIPWLKLAGGLLLVWIAVTLAAASAEDETVVDGVPHFWRAIGVIALADASMSLDNVLAVAAAAHGEQWLFVVGLMLSIPLVVIGASLITRLLARFPVIVWAGAGVLGWVAGDLIAAEPELYRRGTMVVTQIPESAWAPAGAALVLVAAWLVRRRRLRAGGGRA